jgi:hypothetical protein
LKRHFVTVFIFSFVATPDQIPWKEKFGNTLKIWGGDGVVEVDVEVEVEVDLRPTVSPPVCLGVGHPSGTRDKFFFLLEISFGHG